MALRLRVVTRVSVLIASALLVVAGSPLVGAAAAVVDGEGVCSADGGDRPARPAEPVVLCATTVLSGSEAGVVRVRALQEVRIARSFGPQGGMAIPADAVDEAGFAGVALVAHVADRGPGSPMFFGGRFSDAFGGGSETVQMHMDVAGNDLVVPPGDYLLYLLAEGEPVTVTLRLRGEGLDPAGRVEVTPRRPTLYQARSLTPRVQAGSDRQVHSAGDAGVISDSRGLLFQRMFFDAADHVANTHGQCMIKGDPQEDQPPELAYAPGCPNGFAFQPQAAVTVLTPGQVRHTMHQALRSTVTGAWGIQSWWSAAAGSVTDHGAIGIWLSFDE